MEEENRTIIPHWQPLSHSHNLILSNMIQLFYYLPVFGLYFLLRCDIIPSYFPIRDGGEQT